jgi:hypothetical protein
VTVYVPNGGPAPSYGVSAFTPGVACGACGSQISGSPLVSINTGVDGKFVLDNVPVGTNIPLVMQIGRWRRKVTIPNVASCTTTAVSAILTRLPKNQAEGDIPLMAFATSDIDALECVLRKIGIQDSEFSNPAAQGGSGRIRFYRGEDDPGAQISAGTPSAAQLWDGATPDINQYDMVFFPCQGGVLPSPKTSLQQQTVIDYANLGGRVFATHFSYGWLFNAAPFSGTAAWNVEQHPYPLDATGFINTSFNRGQQLAQWLVNVGASTTSGQIPLQVLRHDFDGVVPPSLLWISLDPNNPQWPGAPLQYTFDTPVGAPPANQCGRVLFNDYHVENVSGAGAKTFPTECNPGAMTAQEKLLEYMIFDVGACIEPPVCSSGIQCQSGQCEDGVCCDEPCNFDCFACSAVAKGGGADGICGPVLSGNDPHDDCTADSPASCGFDGTCSGSGLNSCRLYASGTVCGPGLSCNGAGVCQ